jgi:hypothetical protein
VPLDPQLRRRLKLAPLRSGTSRIAFGTRRLGILGKNELLVRDDEHFQEVVRLPITEPYGVTRLFDGSLLALGRTGGARLLPQDKVAHAVRALPLATGAPLLPDRRYPDRLWVLSGAGKALFAYDLGTAEHDYVVADVWVDLDGFDRRAFGSLRDGSFVYTTAAGLLQFYGPQKKAPIAGELGDIFRLLPGSRPDTVWALTRENATLFRILAGLLYRLDSVHFEAMPFATDAAGEYLVALELSQPDDAPWRFVLEVFDVRGGRRLRAELPAEESVTEDWVMELTRDRDLSVWATPPRVAVGGPTHLSVWAADDGKSLYDGP